jgi:hypothetical protein
MKTNYEDRFKRIPGDDPIAHLKFFEKRCDTLKINNVSNGIIKVKIFPYSLVGRAMDWVLNKPLGIFNYWYNIKDAFYRNIWTTFHHEL